jgi:integrase
MYIKRVQDECFRIKDEKPLIIALISDTGMRLSEALGLSRDDVNIEHTYPHIKLKPHLWHSLKTASSRRVVPLVGASYKAINLNK